MNKPIEPIQIPRNVYQRLSDARAEFHTLKLKKTGHNKFAGYNYFELGDFLIPAMDVFRKHGIIGIVSFGPEVAELRVINIDAPEENYVIDSPMSSAALKGCHEVQNLGAVQTYLRRYLWVTALEIVEHDAIGSSKPVDDEILLKAQEAAMNGVQALTDFHKAHQKEPGYAEMWKANSNTLKEAAKQADQELAGVM